MAKRQRERGLFAQRIGEASDRKILKLALRLTRRHLAEHVHKFSPRKFTRLQLFAFLILKAHVRCIYRKCEELLMLMRAVREAIGLSEVPRFTTLQTSADRPEILALINRVLASISRAVCNAHPKDAGADGTGLEVTSASTNFVSGAGRRRTKFVKAILGVLCAGVLPVSLVVDWGPSLDMKQAWVLREKIRATCRPTMLWGDGAFDSEEWHRANWEYWGVPGYVPTTVKSADGRVSGLFRNTLQVPVKEHGRRWIHESVNSGIKRTSGSTLRRLKQITLFSEGTLKVVAYAIKV